MVGVGPAVVQVEVAAVLVDLAMEAVPRAGMEETGVTLVGEMVAVTEMEDPAVLVVDLLMGEVPLAETEVVLVEEAVAVPRIKGVAMVTMAARASSPMPTTKARRYSGIRSFANHAPLQV